MTTTMIKVADVKTPLNIPTPKELFDMTGISKAWPDPQGWVPVKPVEVPDGGTKVMDEWVSERTGDGSRWPYPDMTEHRAKVDQIMSVFDQPYEAESTFVTTPNQSALAELVTNSTDLVDAMHDDPDALTPIRARTDPVDLRFPDGFEATWMPEGSENPALARLLGIAYCKAAWQLAEEEFYESDEDPAEVMATFEAGDKGTTQRPGLWQRIKRAWRVLRDG